MKADILTIPVRNHRVVVVGLKNIQQLRKNGQVAGGIFVSNGTPERIEREQSVEIVSGTQVERSLPPEVQPIRLSIV